MRRVCSTEQYSKESLGQLESHKRRKGYTKKKALREKAKEIEGPFKRGSRQTDRQFQEHEQDGTGHIYI